MSGLSAPGGGAGPAGHASIPVHTSTAARLETMHQLYETAIERNVMLRRYLTPENMAAFEAEWLLRQAGETLFQEPTDGARFRWLTADHDGPSERERCRAIRARLRIYSYGAACADIDAAMKEFGR